MKRNPNNWRYRLGLISFFLFAVISAVYINPTIEIPKSNYSSSQLAKQVTKSGNTERTDYIDAQGKITIAANLEYATRIKTETKQGIIEKYYDDKGKQVCHKSGYYSALREYDTKGNNIRTTFMDQEEVPCLTRDGYAIEEREYNEKKQNIFTSFFNQEGSPVCSIRYGYGMINEYDEDGLNNKTIYLDASGNPMITELGYAAVIRYFYPNGRSESERIEKEFYFDELGQPIALSLGQYGLHVGYNNLGQVTLLTYLDSDGNPITTNKGYATILRTYEDEYNVVTEKYYDIEGAPISLSEGQYGVVKENGKKFFLDQNGKKIINIKQFLYNHSWAVIILSLILIFLSLMVDKWLNMVLLLFYLCVIAYLTIMYRESIGTKAQIRLFWSLGQFFFDSEMRNSILKNIWLFIPFGAILCRLCSRKTILLVPIILSIIIEIIQYFMGTGFCELGDVISNGLGGIVGYGISYIVQKIRVQESKKRIAIA